MPDRFHDAFADVLRGGGAEALAAYLADPDAPGLAVYRNNVVSGAITALGDAYPAVKRLVGERRFNALARAYWQGHPPREPSLSRYGDGFAGHIERWEPAASLVYLADVARLDRAWLTAHHAADAPLLTVRDIQALDPAALGALRPRLHPSVHILTSSWPAWSIWRTNREDDTVTPVRLADGGEIALLHRPAGAVRHRRLEAGEFRLLTAFQNGQTAEAAAEVMVAADADADPIPCFLRLLSEGVFSKDS